MPVSPASPKSLTASVVALRALFSDDVCFTIPWFQRAYAWETVNAGRLLTDVVAAMSNSSADWPYHLGTIKLSRNGGHALAIVDGHQRMMTLTILFAVLRDLVQDEAVRAQLSSMLVCPKIDPLSEPDGAQPVLRLRPQPVVAATFETLIREPGSTAAVRHDVDTLSASEQNALENSDHFRSQLSGETWSDDRLTELAHFLVDRCQVVCEIWEDEADAWRFFQIEEETRLPFDATSRAKASLIEVFPVEERSEASVIWQEIEALLGPSDMFALLGHIRTLRLRRRSEAPLEQDLSRAFQLDRGGLSFLRDSVTPNALRLDALMHRHMIGYAPISPRTARALRRMSWLPRDFWVPAALHWIEKRDGDDAETELFFRRLERLVWCLRIAGIDPATSENRIIRLLAEIDRKLTVGAMQELKIVPKLRAAVLNGLRSNTFRDKHYAVPVLRLWSDILGGDPGRVDGDLVTVEHILPQSPGRRWRDILSKLKLKPHINRLGNLTFLSQADNQRAGALGWEEKRQILAHSGFVLSEQAAREETWSIEVIDRRTEGAIAALLGEWELQI